MLLWWAAVALTSISNCCIWFGALSYLCYLCTHSKPTAGLSKHTEQTRQGCCQDPRVELVYASKAQRAGQRAGPFLSKCGDECMWMEMNGTRNINNSYLPLRWPFLVLRSSFTSLCLLPRWAWLSLWPLYALFSQYITQGTDTSHTKHRLYLCPRFIFLRVKTVVDTPAPWRLPDRTMTHVRHSYLNQPPTIDRLHTKSIFWWHFMCLKDLWIFTLTDSRSMYV